MTPTKRRGRPRGTRDTSGEILAVARTLFSTRGYDATSVRSIAAQAEVDPALVHHYFGTKPQLFAACMRLPLDPTQEIPRVLDGDADALGERLVSLQLRMWTEGDGGASMLALVRSVSSNDQAATMMREFVTGALLAQLEPVLRGLPDASLRAAGAASTLIGMAFARYVVRVPPMATATEDELIRVVGPAVQSYFRR